MAATPAAAREYSRSPPVQDERGGAPPQRPGGGFVEHGFLSSAAPWGTDLTLVLELGMGVGLLIGALLARLRRFGPHAWCQSAVVLFNLALIAATMVPSFRRLLIPALPGKLGKPYYALAAAHAALGMVAQGAGLYILLAVGTKLLPERLRIKRTKLWMRSVLALWWIVLALGVATYIRWYGPGFS
jgi:uncharacterized membrane protein YozB (DUF420 family)